MARYRLFEKNPITNEWIDRDWTEASGQQDAIRQHRGENGGTFFVVPESSFHPVSVSKVEAVRWTFTEPGDDGPVEVPAEEPPSGEE